MQLVACRHIIAACKGLQLGMLSVQPVDWDTHQALRILSSTKQYPQVSDY